MSSGAAADGLLRRRIAWISIVVLSGYLVFVGGVWIGLYSPVLRLLSLALIAGVLTAWGFVAWRNPAWRPRSVLLPAIVACLVSVAISTAFSRLPLISLEHLGYTLLLAALYLLLVRVLADPYFRHRFVVLTVGFFLVISVLYLARNVAHWMVWWEIVGRLTIPPLRPQFEALVFSNPAGVEIMVALLAVPIVASRDWSKRRGVLAAGAVLVITGVVALVSGARAAWLALALTGAVGALVGILNDRGRRLLRASLTSSSRLERAGISLVAIAVLAGVLLLGPPIVQRATAGGEANRLSFVAASTVMFGESPVVGVGPGTWPIEREAATAPDQVEDVAPHAHNLYAQALAELGLVGYVAGAILAASLAWLVIGAVRGRDAVRRRWGWAAFLGLVYYAAHQLLDNYAGIPATLFVASIPIAYLDATAERRPSLVRRALPTAVGERLLAVSSAGLAAVLLALMLLENPALNGEQAVDLANVGDWANAGAYANAAAASDPRISSYLFTAGLAAAHVGDHATAARDFEAVANQDDLSEAWLNLAAERMLLGERDGVRPALDRALRLGIQRISIAAAAGELAYRAGDRALAVSTLTNAVALNRSLLGDPWWAEEPDRVLLREEVVNRLLAATAPGGSWDVALMLGDVPQARRLAVATGVDSSIIEFIDAWAGDLDAAARLDARCVDEPLNVSVVQLCARVEAHLGNHGRADELRYLTNMGPGGGAELRITTQPMIGRSLEGSQATFWGVYSYRRWQPWDMLVPSLLHLEYR